MSKSTLAVVASLAAVLAGVAAWLWLPAAVPPGQLPLTTLRPENVSEFAAAFDGAPRSARLLLLLSPT